MIHAATAGSPRLQCRRMTLLAVKSDQQIDAKAPNRGDETVGAPMAMTQQRAAQRSSTSGEAVTVFGLFHGRSALPGERSATMGASHARFLPTYTQMGGAAVATAAATSGRCQSPKRAANTRSQDGDPPCRQS
jgi:hypothetical protein